MIAVIFEFTPAEGRFPEYRRLAEDLGAYRLRVAQGLRDYTRDERSQAPADSLKAHG